MARAFSSKQEEHSSSFAATQLTAEGNSDLERQGNKDNPRLALSYPRSEPKLKKKNKPSWVWWYFSGSLALKG